MPTRARLRLIVLALALVALLVAGKLTGVTDGWTLAVIRERVEAAGWPGFLLYLVLFALGELAHVPGVLFVGAGLLAWGRVVGLVGAMLGALVSVSVTFFVVRAIGGQPLGAVQRPFMKKLLARLERRPVATVALLRLLFWIAPPLNYALALSPIRYRDFLLGSVVGLVPPLCVVALLVDRLFPR